MTDDPGDGPAPDGGTETGTGGDAGADGLMDAGPLAELAARKRATRGEERAHRQHDRGKLTARERIDHLLDEGSFREVDTLVEHRSTAFDMADRRTPGDAVVTGFGAIDGRQVALYAHDFTFLGGSVGEVVGGKIAKLMDRAIETGVPIIGLNDSAGARIQEGVDSLAGFGKVFQRATEASGLVPQISAIMGPCAGGATYAPALTDFTFMVEDTSYAFITGPDIVETVTGQEVSKERLGGPRTHAVESGFSHGTAPSERAMLDGIRELLAYLPSNNMEDPPSVRSTDDTGRDCAAGDVVPAAPQKPYDAVEVIGEVVDRGSFYEVHDSWARNAVVGFARLDGRSVGVVANQPKAAAGTLDIEASQKIARFVRYCDAFNLPICTLVDVPGFMPGTNQEHDGIIRHGAKLIYAYAEASVPLLTVITRKAYGGAYIVMGSAELGADATYAWPGAELAVVGPKGAVGILYREELAAAEDTAARRAELEERFRERFANPYGPAKRGHIDDVIEPGATRERLIADLELYAGKRGESPPKGHGNIPL
jgi:acetyl-CoA/propionyl-CoA carboxylase carboxyl transferase subunit